MDILLVVNNRENAKIVIPKNASETEKTASFELQAYIEKVTGAKLEIVPEEKIDDVAIFVGHTKYAATKGICGTSAENWIIKGVEGNLILTGGLKNTDRGIIYSVYHFLEEYLGVRWWNFREEYVPEASDLKIKSNVCVSKMPVFDFRKILDIFEYKDFKYHARNRMNIIGDDGIEDGAFNDNVKKYGGAKYMAPPHHVHSLGLYFPADKYFAEHKDWWAFNEVVNDRISYGQFCLSNEGFYQAMLHKLIDNIEAQNKKCEENGVERPVFYSVSFKDQFFMCECPECKEQIKKSGKSGYLLRFVNRLARDIGQRYDGVMLETLAYSTYIEPPLDDVVPERNVIIRYADLREDQLHDLMYPTNKDSLRRIKKWASLCKVNNSPFYVWDYYLHDYPAAPVPDIFRITRNIKLLYELGVSGYFVENETAQTRDFWALAQWVALRMMEDPMQNADDLIDDFISKYYGKAAAYIKEYLMLCHEVAEKSDYVLLLYEPLTNWNYVTPELVKKGMELLDKALIAVEGNAVFEGRVKIVSSGLLNTIAVCYDDLLRKKARIPLQKKDVIQRIIDGLRTRSQMLCYAEDGSVVQNGILNRVNRDIEYFTRLAEEKSEKYALPEELENIDESNVYDIHIKNVVRFFDGESGSSYVIDNDAQVKKVLKLSRDAMIDIKKDRYRVTEVDDSVPQPISFFIKKKNNIKPVYDYKSDIYKKDLVAEKYHLYKLHGIKGVTPYSNSVLYLNHQLEMGINLSCIADIMPFEECDIYISMKASGEYYGGKTGNENALYFERIVIVRTK